MRLLIITQKVDAQDSVLGFFTGWMEEFARQAEKVTVIGQSAQDQSLPEGIDVYSLGKEKKLKIYRQVLRFWRLILVLSSSYDVVLVHMTPIWVVLGSPIWYLLRKKMYLWYEARGARWPLAFALRRVEKVFSASSYGMPIATPKSVIVGHGIDTDVFIPAEEERDEKLLITVGRISRTKRLQVVVDCAVRLGEGYRLVIGGSTLTEEDEEILRVLQRQMQEGHISDRILMGFQSRSQIIGLYQTAGIFLHASTSGLDKTVLEAMACGCLIASSSPAVEGILPPECRCTDENMAETAKTLLHLSPAKKKALRAALRTIVEEGHSLPHLVSRLLQEMGS